jgi:hypothetical protein
MHLIEETLPYGGPRLTFSATGQAGLEAIWKGGLLKPGYKVTQPNCKIATTQAVVCASYGEETRTQKVTQWMRSMQEETC